MSVLKATHFKNKEGLSVPIEIRRRKGARHLRLSIGLKNQLMVSVPWRCRAPDVSAFIEANIAWVESQLLKTPQLQSLSEWFAESPWLSGSGDRFLVRLEPVSASRSTYKFKNGGADIVLRIPESSGDPDEALVQLVRRFAKDAMTCRLAFHAKRLGLKFGKLSVRDQASRWGSCSSSGDISLNWRLVLLEPKLQDYVILHELAHLTEMNHSTRFWRLLESYHVDRVADETALDTLTAQVMRVGRPQKHTAMSI